MSTARAGVPERSGAAHLEAMTATVNGVDDRWAARVRALAAYCATHDERPTQTDADPSVRALAWWFAHWRQAARNRGGSWSPERERFFDDALPAWRDERGHRVDRQWAARVLAAAEFRNVNGVHPHQGMVDPEDRTLGLWLRDWRRAVRTHSTGWSPEREAFMDVNYPSWRTPDRQNSIAGPDIGAVWTSRALAAAAFREEHGFHARVGSPIPGGSELGTWREIWRAAARDHAHGWSPEREAFLDEHYPTWRTPGTKRSEPLGGWAARATAAGAFYTEHGRPPKRRGAIAGEGPLGVWLSEWRARARSRSDGWSPQREAFLDEVFPQWRSHKVRVREPWAARATAAGAFYTEHGRRPTSCGNLAGERSLAVWLCQWRVRSRSRSGVWTPERETFMDEVCPQWRANGRPPRA